MGSTTGGCGENVLCLVRSDAHHLYEFLSALDSGDTAMSCPCFPAHMSYKYFLSFPYPTEGIYQRQDDIIESKETSCGYLVFISSSTSSKALYVAEIKITQQN